MSNSDMKTLIISMAKNPEHFRRDTPLLLKMLDDFETAQRDIKKTIAELNKFPMFKKQAD